jgi:hypothetical protein
VVLPTPACVPATTSTFIVAEWARERDPRR